MQSFDKTIVDNVIKYTFGSVTFNQPADVTPDPDVGCAFDTSLQKFADVQLAANQVAQDKYLSDLGKKERSQPSLKEGISHLAGAWWHVQNYEAQLVDRELALYAVPKMEPTAAAVAIEDREVRDWYRSLEPGKRLSMLAQMQQDPMNPQHQRIQVAMLRSPIALLDQEARLLNDVWREGKRQANPEQAATIDHGRASIDWVQRGLAQLAGLYKMTHRLSDDFVLQTVLTDENPRRAAGYGVFGVNAKAAEWFGVTKLRQQGYRKTDDGVWKKAA